MNRPDCIKDQEMENELWELYNNCVYTEDFKNKLLLEYNLNYEESCYIHKYFAKMPNPNFSQLHSIAYSHTHAYNEIIKEKNPKLLKEPHSMLFKSLELSTNDIGEYIIRLAPVCEASGSNLSSVIDDIIGCSKFIMSNNVFLYTLNNIYSGLTNAIRVMLYRYNHENGEYKKYDELIEDIKHEAFMNFDYIENIVGKRNVYWISELIRYKL